MTKSTALALAAACILGWQAHATTTETTSAAAGAMQWFPRPCTAAAPDRTHRHWSGPAARRRWRTGRRIGSGVQPCYGRRRVPGGNDAG